MKVSVCITTLNEEKCIGKLLESLINQTKRPSEIVITDAGSIDGTIEIIRRFQKKYRIMKLLVEKGISRAKGRNLSVEIAKNDIIAMTDAGCVAKKNWLKNLVQPFNNPEVDIVAGFYNMTGATFVQKAFSVFLGTEPSKFDHNFLPSTRSAAFRKNGWTKVGGFPETLKVTAEDTVFNYEALKNDLRIVRMKNARVDWEMPKTFKEFFEKVLNYAKGDVKSGIWFHPTKGLLSHNTKAAIVFFRYLIGLYLFILGFMSPIYFIILLILFSIYIIWAFRKVRIRTGNNFSSFYGILVQFISDLAVILGFISGIL